MRKNRIKGEHKMKPGLRFMENMDLLSRDDWIFSQLRQRENDQWGQLLGRQASLYCYLRAVFSHILSHTVSKLHYKLPPDHKYMYVGSIRPFLTMSIIVPQGQCSTWSLKVPPMSCAGVLPFKGAPYLVAFGHNPWVILSPTISAGQPMWVTTLFAFCWSADIPCCCVEQRAIRLTFSTKVRLTFPLKTRREAPFNGGSKKLGQESGTQQL